MTQENTISEIKTGNVVNGVDLEYSKNQYREYFNEQDNGTGFINSNNKSGPFF